MPSRRYSVHEVAAQVDHDVVWPRDARHRYRVYGRLGRELTVLCACPEPGGIGQALVQLHQDMKEGKQVLGDLGQIGVLDVMPDGEPHPTGEWIVSPWNRREEA